MQNYLKTDEKLSHSPFLNEQCYDLEIEEKLLEPECRKFADDIVTQKLTLVDFTIYLESLLTSNNAYYRKRGTWLLSKVLSYLPEDLLSEKELSVLVKFYFDRINENYLVVPVVIEGILTIIKMKHLPKDAAENLLNQMFLHLQFENFQSSERMAVYCLLDKCLILRTDEIKKMGLHFVNGVVQATSSERDPDNLLFLFSWLPLFYRTVDMGHLIEDCFEIVGCYFPVDIRTNSRETQVTKREQLVERLASCLCAVPEFAPYLFPLVLEKFDSDLKNAIIDSANILIRGCSVFQKQVYKDYFFEIWRLIKKHILRSNNNEIKEKCLETLAAIFDTILNSSEQIEKNTVVEIFNKFDNEMKAFISLSSENFQNVVEILLVIAKTNPELCDQVINSYVPCLLNQYYLSNDYKDEEKILNTIIDLISVYLNSFKTLQNINLKSIPKMFLNSLRRNESKMRCCAWRGFTAIAQDIPEDIREEFIKLLLDSILNENCKIVRDNLNCFLKKFADFADDCNNLIINSDYYDLTDLPKLNNFLNTLTALSSVSKNTQTILLKIRNYCFRGDIQIRVAFLKCYNDIVNNSDLPLDWNDFIDHFVKSNLEYSKNSIVLDSELIFFSGRLLYNLMKAINFNNEIISKYLRMLFFENIVTPNTERDSNIIIYLSYGLVIGVRRNYQMSNREHIIDTILNTALITPKSIIFELAAKILGNIVNKIEEIYLENYLNEIESKINAFLKNDKSKENINALMTWTAKGLYMRSSIYADFWLEKMFDRLKEVESLAKYFVILLYDDKEVLCTANDCQIRLLYQQKLFIKSLNIIKTVKEDKNEIQYSTALLNLLINLPNPLLLIYFNEIFSTLLKCLSSNVTLLILMALKKIEYVALHSNEQLVHYISDLIPILLNLASNNSSMDVRCNALKCLEYFCENLFYILTPYKQKVVRELQSCLDDPKRIVRLQAIKTRLRWFKVGVPS